MADTRRKRKKINKRVVRKSPDPLSKLEQHYICMNEIYKAARKAGFSESCSLYFVSDRATMPDWVIGDGGIIPSIDPTEEPED
jgi:hypothetical protein